MAGLPGLPPPGFSEQQDGPTQITIGMSGNKGLPGLPPPGFSEQMAQEQPQAPGFLESVGQGATTFLPSLLDSLKSVPSGVSNIYNSITSPIDSINDGTSEKVARGVGGIASGVAGAGVGAMAGAPLAPFTLGLSVPIGAALGGAAGLLGFNKLNQATGSDAPTTPQEDMALLGNATGQGLAGSAIVKGVSLGAKGVSGLSNKIGSNFDDAAQASTEKALGVQYGDRVKGLNRANLYLDDAGNPIPFDQLDDAASIQAPIQKQIAVVKDAGFLDNAPNSPDALKIHLDKTKSQIGQSIQRMMNEGDDIVRGQEPLPEFSKAQEYINSFRDATKAKLTKEFNSIVDDYISEPGTGFKKLAKYNDKLQKETKFDQATPAEVTQLKRFATYDLRKYTENLWDEAVPAQKGAWAKANEQFSALTGLGKTLNKRMAKAEPGVFDYLKGGSLPIGITGGAGSLVVGAPAAFGGAGAALLANSLKNYYAAKNPLSYASKLEGASGLLGNISDKASALTSATKALSNNPTAIASTQALAASANSDNKEKKLSQGTKAAQSKTLIVPRDDTGRFIKHTSANLRSAQGKIRTALLEADDQMKQGTKTAPKDPIIAKLEAKIDADPIDSTIFEMESGRNWKAKNPTSSASGGFQLIKSTAKALGVADPFDPEQNYEGYLKLRQEYSRLARKPEDFYAVHYLGAPTFRKWKNGNALTDKQQEQVDYLENKLIPKFKRIYAQKLKNKSGMVEA